MPEQPRTSPDPGFTSATETSDSLRSLLLARHAGAGRPERRSVPHATTGREAALIAPRPVARTYDLPPSPAEIHARLHEVDALLVALRPQDS